MREWLFNIWQLLKVCLGFIPALYAILAVSVLIILYTTEYFFFTDITSEYTIFKGDLADAKSLINAMLQSMITMTTMVLSITMIVLSLAASQLGPRLIKNFVSNNTTHQYVGFFFGAVIVCAVLIGILHHDNLSDPVPNFSISYVLVFCFLTFCLVLGFINHVAKSCIADHVIARVYDHILSSIKRISIDKEKLLKPNLPKGFDKKKEILKAGRDGFIQNIDYSELLEMAIKKDFYIRILAHAGDHVVAAQPLIEFQADSGVDEDFKKSIIKHMIIGKERTPTQDVEYSFRHLTEIGLRALSPGINDHQTAKVSLDYITAGLTHLFDKYLPNVVYNDEDGKCRIVGSPKYTEHLIEPAILPIMEAGKDNVDMMRHVLKKIDVLVSCDPPKEARKVLKNLLKVAQEYIKHEFNGQSILRKELDIQASAIQDKL